MVVWITSLIFEIQLHKRFMSLFVIKKISGDTEKI